MTTTKRTNARKGAAKTGRTKTSETTKRARVPKAGERAGETSELPATTKRTALARRARPVALVTGGTGFLGSHLVRLLAAEGASSLRVLSTSAPAWLEELGVEHVRGSITSPEDVARAVRGVSEIYHLAGRVSREREDARSMYALHVDGTRLVCDAAREAGVRSLVLASTSGTVAVTDSPELTPDEDWTPQLEIISRWPYYASKLYQERVALEHFAGAGRRLVILNPSLLLGPGDERLSSTKVVLDFLARKIPTVPKGGLSFVDARDAAAAFRAAMDCGRHGERYLLGAVNWTFDEFFARLERLTKINAPRVSLPSRLSLGGARALHTLYRHWKLTPPVE
ncbi:MAG TPA: NAD-dependent epimerase/dehydratase family protein, partial [Pyrinomonadaceae bacterium]|nr:NAD-dependent epimerase/dehydratase family protein [Pyrinomonadaceae bacterium]